MDKKQLFAFIEKASAKAESIAKEIWGYAELSLQEVRSADLYEKALREAGFEVTRGLWEIDTAVVGKYGSGSPVIGILGEYDALSGLSQKSGVTEHVPEPGMCTGHGCGHNLLGAGAFAAACSVREYLKETGLPGTVVFYGCPGEEGGAAKAFFAKKGEWTKLDAALAWHPDDCNQVCSGSNMACIQKEYSFRGVAAHAAGAPEQGRSALDAVELMNTGVQYLREHMGREASVHYAITDAGGPSPNVVQPFAKVLYMVRESSVRKALDLQARVDRIAEAAAMMTDTEVSVRFIDGTSNTVPNRAFEELLYRNFEEAGIPAYTEEELSFAAALKRTYEKQTEGMLPGLAAAYGGEEIRARIDRITDGGKRPMNGFLMPYVYTTVMSPGSTDVGDVSWQTPAAQIHAATWPSLCPGHSWQAVACGKTSMAFKGMLTAAKVLAGTAADLFTDPGLLGPIREEFLSRTKEGFLSPIPDGAKPEIV